MEEWNFNLKTTNNTLGTGIRKNKNAKIKIKLSSEFPQWWPLIRQTPYASGVWGNYEFFIDEEIEECDYWVVYDNLSKTETVRCARENIILMAGEPPSIRTYSSSFLSQFSTVITCQRHLQHNNLIFYQQAQPWHLGRRIRNGKTISFTKSYDELKRMDNIPKTKLISIISSAKAFTQGHADRLAFVGQLVQRFGNQVDVFGNGLTSIEDKWDAIAPYKYHIVIENSRFEDYWTEKLADCYLAGAYPIYFGCPNLFEYFSKEAFTAIDIHDHLDSFAKIEQLIANDTYERSKPAVIQARNLILDKYNLFAVIQDLCSSIPINHVKEKISIHPGA